MSDENDNLFGSDNEAENDSEPEVTSRVAIGDDKVDEVAAEAVVDEDLPAEKAVEQNADLFGSDDEEDNENSVDKEAHDDEDGEDGRSRFSSKQQDLDDLFGGKAEPMFASSPVIVKKPTTVAKLCIPDRISLPDPTLCMAIKMPNFVKIAPTCFNPEKLDVDEEAKLLGKKNILFNFFSLQSLDFLHRKLSMERKSENISKEHTIYCTIREVVI